jgi:hypothetical protein
LRIHCRLPFAFLVLIALFVAFFPGCGNDTIVSSEMLLQLSPCVDYNNYLHWVGSVEEWHRFNRLVKHGDHVFAIGDYSGLIGFDVSQPDSPEITGRHKNYSRVWDLVIEDDVAYVTSWIPGGGLLTVNDVSTPSTINRLGMLVLDGWRHMLAAQDGWVYVLQAGEPSSELVVVNVSSPEAPVIAHRQELPGEYTRIVVRGNFAYLITNDSRLIIADISQPDSPVINGSLSTTSPVRDVSIYGDYLYIINSSSELMVVDISDPGSPVVISRFDTSEDPGAIAVEGDYANIVCSNQILFVDISDPTAPVSAGHMSCSGLDPVIVVEKNHAYVVKDHYFSVLDISSRESPGFNKLQYSYTGEIVIHGGVAYFLGLGALHLVDVRVPGSDSPIGKIDIPGSAQHLAVQDEYCYITKIGHEGGCLQVVDVSNPAAPVFAGNLSADLRAYDVAVQGKYAYLTLATDPKLYVVDIARMSNGPRLLICLAGGVRKQTACETEIASSRFAPSFVRENSVPGAALQFQSSELPKRSLHRGTLMALLLFIKAQARTRDQRRGLPTHFAFTTADQEPDYLEATRTQNMR